MKLYSCDFEGCTATTEKLGSGWKRLELIPSRLFYALLAIPFVGNIISFVGIWLGEDAAVYLCPEHAKRIKGLVRTGD